MGKESNIRLIAQSTLFKQKSYTIYKPLKSAITQIRLMHIVPGRFDDPNINIVLTTADLDNLPDYDALSYSWGDMNQTVEIYLHDTPFQVTINQYEALRRLRLSDRRRIIWVDATCINQADMVERSCQVSIMARIYAGAKQTHVWPGEPQRSWYEVTDDMWDSHMAWYRSEPALPEYMRLCASNRPEGIAHKFQQTIHQGSGGVLAGALFILELLANHVPMQHFPFCELGPTEEVVHNRSFYEALAMLLSILKQPWWTRVWIVQEICTSKSDPVVHIGDRELSLSFFRRAQNGFNSTWQKCQWNDHCLKFVFNISEMLDIFSGSSSYFLLMEEMSHRIGSMSITSALSLIEGRYATDRRDFIYGILSLVKEEHRVPPDYSLEVGQVFGLVSWGCYTMYLDGLNSLKNASGVSSNDLPSWAMDFASLNDTHFGHSELFVTEEARDEDLEQYYHEVGVLQVNANKFETINVVLKSPNNTEPSASGRDVDAVMKWMFQLLEMGYLVESDLLDGNSTAIANFFVTIFREARTIEEGHIKRRPHDEDWKDLPKWFLNLKRLIESGDELAIYDATNDRLAMDLKRSVDGSVLCVTESQRLCLAKESVQQGDCLYHVKGCGVPLALRSAGLMQWRESEDDDEHTIETFRIAGPCYIRGLMGVDGVDSTTDQVLYLV